MKLINTKHRHLFEKQSRNVTIEIDNYEQLFMFIDILLDIQPKISLQMQMNSVTERNETIALFKTYFKQSHFKPNTFYNVDIYDIEPHTNHDDKQKKSKIMESNIKIVIQNVDYKHGGGGAKINRPFKLFFEKTKK
jgi:hypothetical protein